MNQSIAITESLAKGLTSRFFTEMERGIDTAQESFFRRLGSKAGTRNNFNAIVLAARESFADYALGFYEGGSIRKPYVAFDLLTPFPNRLYNTWNEKCLSGASSVINLVPFLCESGGSAYNIGEHAVARLFLRTTPSLVNGLVDIKSIKREMAYVPLWASFWGLVLSRTPLFGKCFPVLPAPTGMFFAHTSATTNQVEIRTFVDDSKLSDDQLKVKRMMLEVSVNLFASPLSSFAVIEVLQIDDSAVLLGYICNKLNKHKELALLISTIFEHIPDSKERPWFGQKIANLIGSLGSDDMLEHYQSFDTIGVRATQIAIQQKYRWR